ncbi:MAG: hypothetical protein NZL96_03655 [Patescibacteria group bacterium]|nr:hypothetical protein [Patescibacteria group bacterium]
MLTVALAQSPQLKTWETCSIKVDNAYVPTLACLEVLFGNILTLSTAFIILVLFVMFVYGSFQYLTSFGNPERVKKAQAIFRYALIGLIVFISSYLILTVIDILFLGGEGQLLRFELVR